MSGMHVLRHNLLGGLLSLAREFCKRVLSCTAYIRNSPLSTHDLLSSTTLIMMSFLCGCHTIVTLCCDISTILAVHWLLNFSVLTVIAFTPTLPSESLTVLSLSKSLVVFAPSATLVVHSTISTRGITLNPSLAFLFSGQVGD
jgi:hypothetical protein